MTVLTSHIKGRTFLVKWLESHISVPDLIKEMRAGVVESGTGRLSSLGVPPSYPYASVGTAMSLAMSLMFNLQIPDSSLTGLHAMGDDHLLRDITEYIRRHDYVSAALVLEPYESYYRSGVVPLHRDPKIEQLMAKDLSDLIDRNAPVLKAIQGRHRAVESRFSMQLPFDVVVGDPDLVFVGPDADLAIVETKCTKNPSNTRFWHDAVLQLLLLAIFASDESEPQNLSLWLHLARQSQCCRVPVQTGTIHRLRKELERDAPTFRVA